METSSKIEAKPKLNAKTENRKKIVTDRQLTESVFKSEGKYRKAVNAWQTSRKKQKPFKLTTTEKNCVPLDMAISYGQKSEGNSVLEDFSKENTGDEEQ